MAGDAGQQPGTPAPETGGGRPAGPLRAQEPPSTGRWTQPWDGSEEGTQGPIQIENYRLGPMIGEGGMGTVYLGWDLALGRRVALKLVRGESQELVDRMVQEAQLQARVEHPAVCRIYQIGETKDRAFIAMQYIQGANLAEWGPHLGLEAKLRLMIQVADAVHAAHRTGLIHRDLKPANLLVEQDEAGVLRPFVMDFGLARDLTGGSITQQGIAVGSPSYMAPEQASGGRVDERTDVYGLGATLYELLSGRPPFRGSSAVETVRQVMETDAPVLRSLDPSIPPDLESVAHKCLEKDPAQRYENARELRDDLQRVLDGEPVRARKQGPLRRLWGRAKRNRALSLVVTAASAAVLLLAGLAALTWRYAREQSLWAQRFGSEVRELDAVLRNAHLFPLHDLRPERTEVLTRLDHLREQMHQLGSASQGPGWFAIGQGRLILDQPLEARQALESAWEGGYRTPEVALALAEALTELRRLEIEAAFMVQRPSLRADILEQVQRSYEKPISTYLDFSRRAGRLTPLQEAVMARLQRHPGEAARLAREAFERSPWNYEARLEEIEAVFEEARAATTLDERRMLPPRLDEAERVLGWLKEAARSDPRVHLVDAQARLLRIRLEIAGKPLEQSMREGLAALEKAQRAVPSSGEPHLMRAYIYRWMAVRQHGAPFQAAYWMDRALEATQKAGGDTAARPRALAFRGSLLLERAEALREAGLDPDPVLQEGLSIWDQALGSKGLPDSQRFLVTMERAAAQRILAERMLQKGLDPGERLLAAEESLTEAMGLENGLPPGRPRAELSALQGLRARAEARMGRDPAPALAEAEKEAQTLTTASPKLPEAWMALGEALYTRDQLAFTSGKPLASSESYRAFQLAAALEPTDPAPRLALARAELLEAAFAIRNGRNPMGALAATDGWVRKALDLDPAAPQALALRALAALGRASSFQNDPAARGLALREAREATLSALKSQPRHGLALRIRSALAGTGKRTEPNKPPAGSMGPDPAADVILARFTP